MLLAQVQTIVRPSLPLLKAWLIITACEYACRHLATAYVSMRTCTGLAHILGLSGQTIYTSADNYKNSLAIRGMFTVIIFLAVAHMKQSYFVGYRAAAHESQ
ncbi:uncharacterized protein N7483_006128 [Penicillium malachiteum]|uniref:uncharacterized protein n=1 Tax=Penicillium malachiteum TaxID=1324776 RepID=UPI002548187B|nr:uncharacterized protein N7483_006128 [Penicillium malachiteum]KAJ5731620.1 hypothetical protein N7483_006128 [Penicillium malachiteum]